MARRFFTGLPGVVFDPSNREHVFDGDLAVDKEYSLAVDSGSCVVRGNLTAGEINGGYSGRLLVTGDLRAGYINNDELDLIVDGRVYYDGLPSVVPGEKCARISLASLTAEELWFADDQVLGDCVLDAKHFNVRLVQGVAVNDLPTQIRVLDEIRDIVLQRRGMLVMQSWHCNDDWEERTPTEVKEHCRSPHCLAGWGQALSDNPLVRRMHPSIAGAVVIPLAVGKFYLSENCDDSGYEYEDYDDDCEEDDEPADEIVLKWLHDRQYANA